MSIRKEEIKFRGQTAYINLNLDTNRNFLGLQQNIDNLTQFKSLDVVNDVVDAEKRRFSFSNTQSQTLQFFFYRGGDWNNTFYFAGFEQEDIIYKAKSILNSFFLLDFFDTYNIANQKKIFSTYLTKIVPDSENTLPVYSLTQGSENQFYYLYIPRSYIVEQTEPIVTGYTRLTFFSGKDGSIKSFKYNDQTNLQSDEEAMFLRTELNFSGRTWRFITDSTVINLYELQYGSEYNDRMDNTADKEPVYSQNYPSKEYFQYTGGTYVNEIT